MAKYCGLIGFSEEIETEPSVWETVITARKYKGDVLKDYANYQNNSNGTNQNIRLSNRISIISDPYANSKIPMMRYIEYMGVKWSISSVEVSFPRLIVSLGDVYNG